MKPPGPPRKAPPFKHGLVGAHSSISVAPLKPLKPAAFVQAYSSIFTATFLVESTQAPPFRHGFDIHSSKSVAPLTPL